jgi:DNA mismatch endonuclease (patch repair protein)
MADNLTSKQRKYCMSRVKQKNTNLEILVAKGLRKRGFQFKKHAKALPGCPDIVFPLARVAVFIDGDFWHGYRLPQWQHKLSAFWRGKIGKNRRRDNGNFAKLRRRGWRVIRIWKHEIQKDLPKVLERISGAVLAGAKQHQF